MQPFKNYIPAFIQQLNVVVPITITNDAYAQQYLQTLLQHKEHYLRIYAYVLEKVFAATNSTNVALLDFGTGNGLLALFAKFCGVKHVYASDVSASFLLAAQQLSKQLNIELDGWIIGNEDTLVKHFTNKPLDIVVGTDVIEHVYNLDHLFDNLYSINKQMITVFTTASVAENWFKSKQLKKLQLKDELEDSNAFQTAQENEWAGTCFLEVRRKIIQAYHPALAENIIEQLATRTRGLRKDDIEKSVDVYLQTNELPNIIKHTTNTCDPITGSWTERLLTVNEYRSIYTKQQTILLLHLGFYNSSEKGFKCFIAGFINQLIFVLGGWGIKIAPFIVLEGRKKN
jgi:2-polyprenyl-3-methyl-5-hydroxy-6-metoxy-1,4-benzoquinol methylase